MRNDHLHHGHEHGAEHGGMDESIALLNYMLEHNRAHAAELDDVAHKFEHLNRHQAAAALREAVELFGQGNEKLASALKALSV